MCAILQLVSAPLNPIPIAEHFRRSHPQCEHSNVMFHCFDHEIVLEAMKEEISQQRCTIGAHWYTNNLPENRASKTNVDVVDMT